VFVAVGVFVTVGVLVTGARVFVTAACIFVTAACPFVPAAGVFVPAAGGLVFAAPVFVAFVLFVGAGRWPLRVARMLSKSWERVSTIAMVVDGDVE